MFIYISTFFVYICNISNVTGSKLQLLCSSKTAKSIQNKYFVSLFVIDRYFDRSEIDYNSSLILKHEHFTQILLKVFLIHKTILVQG